MEITACPPFSTRPSRRSTSPATAQRRQHHDRESAFNRGTSLRVCPPGRRVTCFSRSVTPPAHGQRPGEAQGNDNQENHHGESVTWKVRNVRISPEWRPSSQLSPSIGTAVVAMSRIAACADGRGPAVYVGAEASRCSSRLLSRCSSRRESLAKIRESTGSSRDSGARTRNSIRLVSTVPADWLASVR